MIFDNFFNSNLVGFSVGVEAGTLFFKIDASVTRSVFDRTRRLTRLLNQALVETFCVKEGIHSCPNFCIAFQCDSC